MYFNFKVLFINLTVNNYSFMSISDLRIVFLGTPDFAVASLNALVETGFNVVGVITAPDKPAGRGMKLTESAVKKYAISKGLTVLQPEKLKNPIFIEVLRSLCADIQVVVAFRMLPEIVWNMPLMGTINVHGSLLPQYRGAAPINWAVINGETETGVTTFKLQHEIDTGDILKQTVIQIGDDENAGELHDKMMLIGATTLVETLNGLIDGSVQPINQNESSIINRAPKIFTETCKIDWNQSTESIFNLIRGLSPFPTAYTFINDKKLKIFACKRENTHSHTHEVGEMVSDNKTFLKFACTDGFIIVTDLQLEGKKRMNTEEFLRGFRQ